LDKLAHRMTVLLANRPGRDDMVREAIASVKAQTVPVRLIVASNGAGTGHLQDCPEVIVSEVMHDDAGQWSGEALMRAWNGQGYACLLHDDDVMRPDRCEKMADLLDEGYDLAFSGYRMFGTMNHVVVNDSREWRKDSFDSVLARMSTPTAAFNSRLLEVKPPQGYRCGAQDSLYWFRCLHAGLRIGFAPDILYDYRTHGGEAGNCSSRAVFYRFGEDEFNAEVEQIRAEARILEGQA